MRHRTAGIVGGIVFGGMILFAVAWAIAWRVALVAGGVWIAWKLWGAFQ